jgi:type I restriction enzyme S subunit
MLVFRHYMRSGRFRQESRITTNIAHLSASRFASIEFPLPPLNEQELIVNEAERQLSIIDDLTAVVSTEVNRSLGLRRSVLAAAFSGRLIGAIT